MITSGCFTRLARRITATPIIAVAIADSVDNGPSGSNTLPYIRVPPRIARSSQPEKPMPGAMPATPPSGGGA
jgi:hypothetical protein